MPLKHQSLPELLIDLEQEDHTKSVASYTFRNTFFMDSMKLTEAKVESLHSAKNVYCL